jgi:replicative DNA helicase
MTDFPTQLPPQDLEAEQALLGAVLVEPGAAALALSAVLPEDFYREAHQRIFRAVQVAYKQGGVVDLIAVCAELRRCDLLNEVGGAEYLDSLISTVPTAAHIGRYCDLVVQKAQLRRLIQAASDIQQAAYNQQEGILGTASQRLLEALGEGGGAAQSSTAGEIATAHQDRLLKRVQAKPQPQPPFFGIEIVDAMTGGLGDEEVVAVEAFQKHGKTALLRQSALYTARWLQEQGRPETVPIYNLEGSSDGWLYKAYAYLGYLHTGWLKQGSCYVPEGEVDTPRSNRAADVEAAIFSTLGKFSTLPVTLNDQLSSLAQIENDLRVQIARGAQPIGVWIDYAQKIRTSRRGNDAEIVRSAWQGLVEMHRCFKIPVITGSQVTRDQIGGGTHGYMGRASSQECSLIVALERGKASEKNESKALKSTEARLVCRYTRYDTPFVTVNLCADLDHARFAELGREEQPLEIEGPDQRH